MAAMRRALLSVSDKTGIVALARGLADLAFELVSTGGTARALREAGLPVTDVSEVTGFPECLDGRVKTLHPAIHAGLLARDTAEHRATLEALGVVPIDVVAVNLYPFEATVARPGVTEEDAVENIDVGGPSMVRAAAKNAERVAVLVDPADYEPVLAELRSAGEASEATRRRLRAKAFALTAAYDAAIAAHFAARDGARMPPVAVLAGVKSHDLRYGENPHQAAALYVTPGTGPGIAGAVQRQGKALSYNNLLDMEAAWALVREFDEPAVVIVKHNNPCGVATDAASLAAAYEGALATDPVSAFGGIVACNREVDGPLAARMCEHFFEVVVAPAIAPDAAPPFAAKRNLRVMELGPAFFDPLPARVVRAIAGGLLVQEADPVAAEARAGRVVTARAPTAAEWDALDFAWRVAKHVKSNAIVFARARATAAVGAGQMSRVDSVRVAAMKAVAPLAGTAVGSDAFFPFPDGVEEAARAGATSIVQPGGSMRDAEVIAAADRLGLAMVLTGRRHFRH